ncbi:unnamed protein product [Didymodactylos carnosus]|uniref:Uncharacterized protein n=1 Tax=Didymodactylos carnosus TaxID=1234261 RepID=A0A814YMW5_9BILA|nr:unnamed protein product [Didymodactylos carnosus]CAF1231668.1 unnamed protein product [Didymodactylos carnosus]CAF3794827.1 unnamed protein product [Didymodactylos carnosus]CAF3994317.1 unnamed protein product [Didymodactylos carnosus]
MSVMILATVALMYRLLSYEKSTEKQTKPLKKLTIHIILYVIWFTITYCPTTFYRMTTTYDPKQYTTYVVSNILAVFVLVGVQTYPIITDFLLSLLSNKQNKTTEHKYNLKWSSGQVVNHNTY